MRVGFGSSARRKKPSGYTGGGDPVIAWDAAAYFENFDAIANGTRFVANDTVANYGLGANNPGNLGWDAIAVGGANAARFNPIVHDGMIRQRTSGNYGDFTSPGSYFLKPPGVAVAGDQYLEIELVPSANNSAISFKATDASNQVNARFSSNGGAVSIHAMNAGASVQAFSASPSGSARLIGGLHGAFSTLTRSIEKLTVSIVNGRAYFAREGQPIGDPLGYTFTDPGGSFVGFTTFDTTRPNWITSIRVGSCSTKLRALSAFQFHYSRRLAHIFDEGSAIVPQTGTYQGAAPTRLIWRLIDPETGIEVKPWEYVPLADQTIGGGNYSFYPKVPCGRNGRRAYLIQHAAVDANGVALRGSIAGSNKPFAVVIAGISIGQSNVTKSQTKSGAGVVPLSPGGYMYSKADPPSMVAAGYGHYNLYWDSTAATGAALTNWKFLDMLSAYFNKPVAILSWAIAAQGAANLDPVDGPYAAYLQQHIALSGQAWEFALLGQGEAEFTSQGALWLAQWKVNLTKYLTFNNQYPGFVPPIFITKTGRNPGNAGASQASTLAMRLGQEQLVIDGVPGCVIKDSGHWLGCPMKDSLHYTETISDNGGYEESARRDALSVIKHYSGAGYDGQGPLPLNAVRTGDKVRINLDLNGATSLTARDGTNQNNAGNAAALTGFQISANDFASNLTITSTAIGADYVEFTLSADPGGPVKWRCDPGSDPTVTSWPFGAYADGTQIGMKPKFSALLAA
ncbi:MAG: hypothetical protein J0H88_16195 [Sphingomonadales bacterium]|nr:hypothetical protein [Sphingomonadales bacterium]